MSIISIYDKERGSSKEYKNNCYQITERGEKRREEKRRV
jgi:hypothetical protein